MRQINSGKTAVPAWVSAEGSPALRMRCQPGSDAIMPARRAMKVHYVKGAIGGR